jgi:acetoin utilization deacetylase AcuC-like enzyme
LSELGGPNAVGSTINIPLPPNTSGEGILHAIREVVLPILKEFQPEIVVNSAGQDNHYSDPITNMNFSAQGYAELTTLLKPDIAVLEGGYAIEGALPYVNAGIILAMAGMDYSHLKEPDYDPVKIRQSPEISRWVHKTCDKVLENWHQRRHLAEKFRGDYLLMNRDRNILLRHGQYP